MIASANSNTIHAGINISRSHDALDKVPKALRDRSQWLVWRLETRKGKATKVPYQAKAPSENARTDNPATWADFETAKAAYLNTPGVSGIGFVFTDDDPFVGIDVDHVRNPDTGEWDEGRLEEAIGFGSYAELSPSGTGLHVIVIGEKPGKSCRKGNAEMYSSGRYFTVTGEHIKGTPDDVMEAAPGSLEAFYETIRRETIQTSTPAKKPSQNLNDKVVVALARAASNGEKFSNLCDEGSSDGYDSPSEADAALCTLLAFYSDDADQVDRIFRSSGLMREKWDKKDGNGTYGSRTIENTINLPKERYNPRSLPVVELTKSEKAAITKAIPPNLEDRINNGGLLFNSDVKTSEDFHDLTLYLLAVECKTIPEVGKVLAGRNKKIPESDRLTVDELKTVMSRASDKLTEGRKALEAEAIAERVAEIIESRAKVEADNRSPPEIVAEATKILRYGNPIEYHRKAFGVHHSGDREIADVWLMAAMTQAAVTTTGIQPGFTGKKGAGKSSGVRAALHLHPQEYVQDSTFSAKALLYDSDLRPGSIFYTDDTYADAESKSMMKRAMTQFQTGITHKTVNKREGENASQTLQIPPRCCFASSNVYGDDDDELKDRMYLISLSPTPQDDQKFVDHHLNRLADGREEYPVTHEVLVCREMIRQVKQKVFRVIIPFRSRLVFSDPGAKRDILMLTDFIQASAILNHLKRECSEEEEGVITVTACDEDFHIAIGMFQTTKGTRKFKISQDERALLSWLGEQPGIDTIGIEENAIITKYGTPRGMSRMKIRRLLYGYNSKAGIVNMVPGVYKELVSKDTTIGDGRKSVNVITVMGDVGVSLSEFGAFATLLPDH